MKRKQAFTLVELLISLIITGLVMASVITLFFSVFKSYELHQDITEAKQRGHIALAAIQPFILNAGLGLPASDLSSVFRDDSNPPQPITVLAGFSRPVQLAVNNSNASTAVETPALWLLYSVPSGAGVNEKIVKTKDTRFTKPIIMQNFEKLGDEVSTNKQLLKAWVAFPSTTTPFAIDAIDVGNKTVTLKTIKEKEILSISPFDEMHFVRAVKVYVNTDDKRLYIDRLDGSNPQPVIDGIAGMWCSFDPDDDRVLTIWLLARSSEARTEKIQAVVEGWPAAAEGHWGRDERYRHAVVSRSWRIRN